MRQSWHDLLFAHWPLPPERVRPLLPAELELDTFDGAAWIGVIPFRMSNVRLRRLPPAPGASAFLELNVRTYIRHRARAGVWFFSLDAQSPLAVAAARAWFGLPYYCARMQLEETEGRVAYRSQRTDHRGAPAELRAEYHPTGPLFHAKPGTLEHFLTERYCLISRRRTLLLGEIHHAPWNLQPAEADFETNTMTSAIGLELPPTPPLLLFSHRLDMLGWHPAPLD
jgi:uncharacterized protein